MAIQNRYEFLFYIQAVNANPNGDPDMGNLPRMDPQDNHGYITDGALKRRIRNYVQLAYAGRDGMDIFVRSQTNLNTAIAEVKELAGVVPVDSDKKEDVNKGRAKACAKYYDVRAFGAVMSTGPNAGQVRGPVQLTFARSLDPIAALDISITRMATTNKAGNAKTMTKFKEWEDNISVDELRTMGRKQFIPYGLYEARGFISANLAQDTGFDEADLKALFEAIMNMYEHDRSASKGMMSVVSPLVIFKHVGTDSDETQRVRQARLGCAPAHRLFDLVSVRLKEGVEYARSWRDYDASIALDRRPAGVDIGFLASPMGEIVWNTVPEDAELFH